ncbi:PepSY domain-containing protein [Polymorphospora sp. NPDC051019]|uniref:PepSY domain-containing protein n=1 Tax=Polymorphospora sp. NPDC051019 TaxID=3155725 RepID=UPI0034459F00
MTRKSIVALAVGGVAALAFTGTALGVAAASDTIENRQQTTSVALTSAPGTPGTPGTPDTAPTTGPTSGETSSPAPTQSSPTGGPASGVDAISAERAKEIALGRVGGGTVEEVDRDREHGRPVWEVEIYKGQVEYEVDVDRETGEIVKFEQDDDDDDDHDDDDHDDDDDRYDD